MSCMCENRKRMEDIGQMRSLAKKAAMMDGKVYVLYENDGIFGFVPEGVAYKGEFIEYVWYI